MLKTQMKYLFGNLRVVAMAIFKIIEGAVRMLLGAESAKQVDKAADNGRKQEAG